MPFSLLKADTASQHIKVPKIKRVYLQKMCLQFHLHQTFFLLMLPLFWINYCVQMSVNLIFRILHESTTNLSSHLLPSGLSFRNTMDLTMEIV